MSTKFPYLGPIEIKLFRGIFVKASGVCAALFLFESFCLYSLGLSQAHAQEDAEFSEESEPTQEEASSSSSSSDTESDSNLADDFPSEASPTTSGQTNTIEVRTYDVKIVRFSKSMRVYLFDDQREIKPAQGKIILLRDSGSNVMAFRAIKTYSSRKQFAASRVRTYGDFHFLEPGTTFKAYEKIGDLNGIPQGETDDLDQADLESLEADEGIPKEDGDSLSNDETLDETFDSDEPAEGSDDSDEFSKLDKKDLDELDGDELSDELSEDDDLDSKLDEGIDDKYKIKKLVIEVFKPLEKHKNWLSLELDYFLASGRYLSGFAIKLGTNIGSHLFIEDNTNQDVLTLEGGLGRFSAANLSGTNDNYTVMPLLGHLRYNVFFSETFLMFLYGGFNFNLVLDSINPNAAAQASLSGLQIALGGGAMVRFGPQWFLRLQLGIDSFGAGLVLRF